jgi:hypothetical protein
MPFSENDYLFGGLDPTLLQIASEWDGGLEKVAIVPAGDPSGGGMPPPGDPAAAGGGAPPGGAPPAPAPAPAPTADPAMIQAIAQQVMQQIGGGGAGGAGGMAGGMAGKPPKKAEDAIRDAKMFAIDLKLTAIMNHLNIAMPPEATLGAPPDPQAASAAAQEHANASGVPSDPDTAAAAPPPGPPGIDPVAGMDPAQGPIGKTAGVFGDSWPTLSDYTSPLDLDALDPEPTSMAARIRSIMGE